MSESTWSDAEQIGHLWYKFKHNPDGRWEILCSGDRDSLETNTVVSHDHYWQRNGSWYCQVKVGTKRLMHKEDFIDEIKRQNQESSLNLTETEKQELNLSSGSQNQLTSQQIDRLADYKARQAYGSAGYGGSNIGIEVSPYEAAIFERIVSEHQSTTSSLNWRDANDDIASVNDQENITLNWRDANDETVSVNDSENITLNWRDSATTNDLIPPSNYQIQSSTSHSKKSTRKSTR